MRDRTLIALAALVALGAALRFATLDLQSYWYDEAITVGIVRMDFHGMLSAIYRHESTPPLYYVLAWIWCKVFGTGEVGLRSLSALFGTASIPVFYAAARELVSRQVGLAVAALAALNPLLVWYSQEGRAYALLALLGGVSLLFFARLVRGGDGRSLAWWALFSGLALLTHYFAVFLVLPEAAWLVWRRRDRAVAAAVAAVALVAVALLPLALHQQSLDLASFIRGAPLGFRLARVPKQYLVGYDAPLEVAASVVAALVALAGLALAGARLRERAGVRAAAGLVLAGVAIPFVLALAGLDYFETRNLLALWLPFAVAVAAGLVLVGGRRGLAGVALLGVLGLAAVIAVDVVPNWRRDDWRGAAQALGPTRELRAVVVTPASGRVPLALYVKGLTPMPSQGVSLDKVALVSKGKRVTGKVHPPAPPRPRNPQIPGFVPLRHVYADSYSVVLFQGGGVGVTPASLSNFGLLRGSTASVLLQRPGR
jgi:4-amino-4-deoxy-L-arabinose transferase-like glycosyltransferase